MSIMKLLPLLYLVAKASAMWLPGSYQAYENTNIENCICPMKSPSIINKLDSNNSGIERLVVYVYRKPDTGEIVSFVPEKEHQRKIPDLPEMNGRIHAEQNPSIKEIFEKSSSRDLRQHIRPDRPLPHHKSNENRENVFIVDGKIPKLMNEKYFESEIEIPKWQIPVDDVISESQVKVQHINPHPQHIPGENIHKKTEIMIDNDDLEDSRQHQPIPEDSTLDISSEYINKKPNTYEEYPVSVKPLKINNPDLDAYSTESTLIQSFESQSDEISSEPVIPDGIESPGHIEQSSFENSIYIRPHMTGKNQIAYREQATPEGIEWPRHKEQSSFEDSVYIRPHVTEKNQITYREQPTPEGIVLPRHKEQSSFEDSVYVRPHVTEENQITYREQASPEEIELPRHKEQSSFEDSVYIRPQVTEKNQITYREQPTPEGIELPRHKEQSSFEDSVYIRPHVTEENQITYREQASPEEIELPRHKEQSSFEDSVYIRPHVTEKNQITYRQQPTPEGIELPRHKEQSSFEDYIHIRPHVNEKNQITYREQAIPEGIEWPKHKEQDSFEDSIYIRPHVTEKNQITYREQPTPEGIEWPRHKEQNSYEDSIHPIYIRPHTSEKNQISFREDQEDMVPRVKRIKMPRKDKHGKTIGWIMKTIKIYKNSGSNSLENWREYRVNRHKPFSYHSTGKYNLKKDSAFDEWLKEQLRITTLNGNRIPTSNADILALDKAIRNVLLQNGWLVTEYGTLVDGTGKTSSLNNLKLRPILVGKSYSYDSFIKQGTHKMNMSTKRPYLEGLLFTMIKPAKILGIVPLSITSYSQTRRPYNSIGGSTSSKRQKKKMKVLPIEELVSFRKDSKSSKSKAEGSKHKTEGSNKKQTDAAHLKNALSEVQQSQHGKGTTTTIIQTKGKVYNFGNGKHIGSGVSEEVPDWRIIGGTSATISGTPLDFKGRSGAPST